MKDNKGMTIVEILVSVCIISLVLTLLFSLLIQVKEEENNNNIQSNFLINQSTFITQIEEDIINYGVKAIAPCYTDATGNPNDINHSADGRDGNYFYCVKIFYAADYIKDNIGIIQIYNYYQKYSVVDGVIKPDTNSGKWSIRYQRGHYNKCENNKPTTSTWDFGGGRIMKDMPSEIDLSARPYINYTVYKGKTNAASLVIPIANLDGEHYDINLSFTFKNPIGVDKKTNESINFICQDNEKLLKCNCAGATDDCNNTLIKSDENGDLGFDKVGQLNKYQCGTN